MLAALNMKTRGCQVILEANKKPGLGLNFQSLDPLYLFPMGGSLFAERNCMTVMKLYIFCKNFTPVASSENRIFSKCFAESVGHREERTGKLVGNKLSGTWRWQAVQSTVSPRASIGAKGAGSLRPLSQGQPCAGVRLCSREALLLAGRSAAAALKF